MLRGLLVIGLSLHSKFLALLNIVHCAGKRGQLGVATSMQYFDEESQIIFEALT